MYLYTYALFRVGAPRLHIERGEQQPARCRQDILKADAVADHEGDTLLGPWHAFAARRFLRGVGHDRWTPGSPGGDAQECVERATSIVPDFLLWQRSCRGQN